MIGISPYQTKWNPVTKKMDYVFTGGNVTYPTPITPPPTTPSPAEPVTVPDYHVPDIASSLIPNLSGAKITPGVGITTPPPAPVAPVAPVAPSAPAATSYDIMNLYSKYGSDIFTDNPSIFGRKYGQEAWNEVYNYYGRELGSLRDVGYKQRAAYVNALSQQIFDRPAEGEGLAYWAGQVKTKGADYVVKSLTYSDEALMKKYGLTEIPSETMIRKKELEQLGFEAWEVNKLAYDEYSKAHPAATKPVESQDWEKVIGDYLTSGEVPTGDFTIEPTQQEIDLDAYLASVVSGEKGGVSEETISAMYNPVKAEIEEAGQKEKAAESQRWADVGQYVSGGRMGGERKIGIAEMKAKAEAKGTFTSKAEEFRQTNVRQALDIQSKRVSELSTKQQWSTEMTQAATKMLTSTALAYGQLLEQRELAGEQIDWEKEKVYLNGIMQGRLAEVEFENNKALLSYSAGLEYDYAGKMDELNYSHWAEDLIAGIITGAAGGAGYGVGAYFLSKYLPKS